MFVIRSRRIALGIAIAVILGAGSASADPLHEPNETIHSATGPLASNLSYSAGIEAQTDRDVFFFYVTAPRGTSVTISVQNTGGGPATSDLKATLLDTSSSPIGALSYVRKGETRSLTLDLAPQKYYIEVAANSGFGDGYSLSTADGPGAFGSFAVIAGRCGVALARIDEARREIRHARAKLERAVTRVRRSRYGGRHARQASRANQRKARQGLSASRRELHSATQQSRPWCSIPQ